ncbi:MAG: C25 family cysteine peptidase, partial [Candidatus Cloacimonetes bacterium]|nr:C25 family cysteine peptidase [Candidatus Cloacimonadota bacterium]
MQGNKLLVTLLMIIVIIGLFTPLAAQSREVQLSGNPSNVRLQNNSDYGFELRFTVDKLHLQSLDTKGGTFDEISIDGFGHTGRIGEAKLPVSSRIVAVPLGAEVRFEILASESVNLSQRDSGLSNQIIPAQASVSKSADYATLPFEKSSVYYASDQLSKNPSFRIEEIGVLRGVRLFQFYFEPVKYNPVSGDLQIITTADIKVDFINPDLVATENLMAKTASWEFEQLYAKSIFNWNHDTRTSLVRNPTKMVILCPSAYSSTMAPYIEWKRKEGLIVNLVTVGTGGTVNNSTTAIKSYMQGLWNSATTQDPAPTYLIIVGDHGTTGNNITANTGSAGSHVTDLNYVRLNGTDYLPEMYFGRFSVSSSTELTNVINKTLMFAQTSMPDLSYLGKTVLIAGVDASWAPTHGNGAINYATEHYFNTAHGITSNNYPYPQSGSSDAQIVANAAEGRGYLNYTAHGSQTAWHDPNFTSTQMMNLTNTNKPFVAVGNCCITNEFDYSSPCFGEAIIRSNNAGAAYIGGTNSTYWDEDFYWAVGYKTPQTTAHPYDPTKLGAYDAMFHAPTNVADWAQTMGETMFMGNMAVQASTSSRKNYYWEIYSIMGDPSLMPYYGVPTVNTATFPAGIMLGLDSMNITAEAYSRVALSMNGTLYASEIVPASGSLTLNFTPFTTVGTADLVITRSGKITRQETIQVLPASGPYMTVETNVYADSNNNQPDYNESGRFNTTFKNVGANSVSNVTATLSCATAGITITDATESIASLAAGASITRNNAFAFSIANNVADGTLAAFTITMVSGTNSWTHEFNLELNAPVLSFGNITISDPSGNNNGRLDPGETVTISIPILNGGGAASLSGSATLSCNTTGITVNTGTANFSAIAANSSRNVSFSLSASASMSLGSIANLVFNASAGSYSATKNEAVAVGLVLEDFETGNFNSYPWIMEGTLPWTISSVGAYQGTYTAKSGAITNSQSSTMKTSRILSSPGTLRFRYKVSSESGYDFLKFYVDGIQQGSWSGEVDWTEATYELAAGIRELSWSYTKDGSVLDGSDCAWVDYIVFPASTSPSSFFPPRDLTASVGNGIVNLNWLAPVTGTPSSYRIYKNGSLLTDVTTLSYTDTAVVNETTYSYYVTTIYSDPAGESEPSNTVQAMPTAIVPTEVVIGTGTNSTSTSTASPINIWYKSLHGQSVYTAAELNAAGIVGASTLNEIGFNITGLPAYAMPNFMIRIGHTDASDASSWIETGLTTVYSNASYLPDALGWSMYNLSTPFEWNGVDNIVVDTAFGLLENYSSSGTVQYSEVTSGYRYNRNDSSDQTNNFSDGSTSTYRPNLKIAFNPIASDEARIYVNPASLEFEEVNLGSSESQTLRISNSGDIPLTGTVTTPTGFSISQRRAGLSTKAERNTISISIPARENRDYQVVFSPTTATAYSGNIVISSNATNNPSLNVPVSGFGYLAPTIGISAGEVS